MKCKTFKGSKTSGTGSFSFTNEYDYELYPYLNEKVAHYNQIYSIDGIQNYMVVDFPVAYHKMSYDEYLERKDIENDDEINNFGYEDSTKHFKVSGKKWAKAFVKKMQSQYSEYADQMIFITLSEPKSIENAYEMCEDYNENNRVSKICNYDDSYNLKDFYPYLRKNYEEYNAGNEVPYIKSQYKKEARSELNSVFENLYSFQYLYTIALMNLIIQIVGVVIWAGGIVIGLLLGGGLGHDNSEKEEA